MAKALKTKICRETRGYIEIPRNFLLKSQICPKLSVYNLSTKRYSQYRTKSWEMFKMLQNL